MEITQTVRTIVVWTLALSAAALVFKYSSQFNSVITNLTGNYAKLLVVGRGDPIPRV
jgi:hypothetical protein